MDAIAQPPAALPASMQQAMDPLHMSIAVVAGPQWCAPPSR
ncbi:hypothetical protein [Xanthomonas arboricola]|nr:hypothetical protein [Xanthomonas arboricola]